MNILIFLFCFVIPIMEAGPSQPRSKRYTANKAREVLFSQLSDSENESDFDLNDSDYEFELEKSGQKRKNNVSQSGDFMGACPQPPPPKRCKQTASLSNQTQQTPLIKWNN